jgi:hypothetical protein
MFLGCVMIASSIDRPFIVLTETKFQASCHRATLPMMPGAFADHALMGRWHVR